MSKFFKGKFQQKLKPKDPRPMSDIQNEYTRLCAQLGNIEYQIKTLEVEKGTTIAKMSEINLEASLVNSEVKEEVINEPEGATNG